MNTTRTRKPLDPVYGRMFTVQTNDHRTLHVVKVYDEKHNTTYLLAFDPNTHTECVMRAYDNSENVPWEIA